jgi:two-component system, OmpR family, phosphate regulon sensor histidine kinase PhoR
LQLFAIELAVRVLCFLLGLIVGLALWRWQRSRYDARFKKLLGDVDAANIATSAFSSTSQLAIAIAHNQTNLRQLEQQVETYKQILQTAPIGYLQVDDENRLLWCNVKARELLAMASDQQSKPRLLLELVRSFELDHLIEQTREAKSPCKSDWTFYPVSPDPSHLSQQQAYALRGYGLPLPADQVGIFLENRQESVTLVQQRDRWASDVAHELKTPLTSIRLVAETLQTRLEPPLKGWVDRLINETIRLSNLVQDLLDLSQIDRNTPSASLKTRTTDLVELIFSAWANLEPLARKKHLRLDYSGPDRLLMQLDEPRMYRVLFNLLDNSIKYSPPRQQIRVQIGIERLSQSLSDLSTTVANQQIRLEVIDAGPGFPENSLPYVFERFYRADPSRSHSVPLRVSNVTSVTDSSPNSSHDQVDLGERNSSGLGLAIVEQIVEAHAGSVSASNHPDTGGAWLQVCLPWHQPDLT